MVLLTPEEFVLNIILKIQYSCEPFQMQLLLNATPSTPIMLFQNNGIRQNLKSTWKLNEKWPIQKWLASSGSKCSWLGVGQMLSFIQSSWQLIIPYFKNGFSKQNLFQNHKILHVIWVTMKLNHLNQIAQNYIFHYSKPTEGQTCTDLSGN